MNKIDKKHVYAAAQWINTDAPPSAISQTLMNSLTGCHFSDPVIISPAPNCSRCSVIAQPDGMTNLINLTLEVPVGTTDDQIVAWVTYALVNLSKKDPFRGTVWANIGPVNILEVSVVS